MWLASQDLYNTRLIFPFFKQLIPDLGWFYVPFAVFVLVAWSNAVNLTDGLDGLAISTFAMAAATLTALTYVTGHRVFAEYLLLVRFAPAAELTIFCGALVGASLGFLWYNAHPAEIFMGDVGSLALGGALATVAILIKQELLLVLVGGVFVLEAALGRHPGRLVQAAGQAHLQDGPAAPPLRTHRLAGAEGDHAILDRGPHLRALQPDVVEAEMKATDFSVKGQRVLVVGAARSGVAAALLLVRRGASVTLTDRKAVIGDAETLQQAGVRARARRASWRNVRARRPGGDEPRSAAGVA